ncbi:CRAL-TRIO domain-containing protein [Xylariaceae sp. FL0255]|nr:CRAL-TRIO domain-containing protein [Xylariaceae sp. FL0255]
MKDDSDMGYIGSLRPDQEKKLQQLWALLLASFNFQHDAETDLAQDPGSPVVAPSIRTPSIRSLSIKQTSSHKQVDVDKRAVKEDVKSLAKDMRDTWINMLKQEDPDVILLRFLRNRKWDITQAFSLLNSAFVWRCKEAHVDDEIIPQGESWCVTREKLRMGKVFIHGTDNCGRPIVYIKVKIHKPGAQSEGTLDTLIVHTIETARCLLAPPVESFCVVFDLTRFTLSNMEWHPVKFIIRSFESNYPECLGVALIHNAPRIFEGIWKVIRGLLSPRLAAKVTFTRGTEGLEKYIPKENILASMGGAEQWQYQYHEPSDDDDGIMLWADARNRLLEERQDIATRLFAATQLWIDYQENGDDDMSALQQQLRTEYKEELRVNYWALDPYVRCRTQMDRLGIISPGGMIDPYPERKGSLMENTSGVRLIDDVEDDGGGSGLTTPWGSVAVVY